MPRKPRKIVDRNYSEKTIKLFWEKVNKQGPKLPGMSTCCWVWTAVVNKINGYGYFSTNKWKAGAHQVAWELDHGPLPAGLEVRHDCDNRICVRHLRSGTRLDNMRDAVVRGRTRTGARWQKSHYGKTPAGERHYNSKLLDLDVVNIRRLCARGVSQKALAKQYKVCRPHISKIVNFKKRNSQAMPVYEYSCPVCRHTAETYQSIQEAFAENNPGFHCKECYSSGEKVVKMERIVSMPAPAKIGPGRSAESKKDWADKRKHMLEARSLAHDKSPDGMEQRMKSILRLKKSGTLL